MPWPATCPAEISLADALDLRETQPEEYERRSRAAMAAHVRAMLAFQRAGAIVFDYGNNLRAQAQEAGVDGRVRLPGLRAGVHPAPVLRGPRAVPLGRPVRRPGRHPADRPGGPRALPRRRRAAPLDRDGRGARPVPGPAGPDLLARLRRAGAGRVSPSTSWSGPARSRPDRHRSRPPRRGLGRLAQPRDRGDGRRLRRGRGLAVAQRAGQHGRRRDVGLDPPRRRRRDRLLASTPGWSWSPTGRRSRPRSWSAS